MPYKNPYNEKIAQELMTSQKNFLTNEEVCIYVPETNSKSMRDATGAFHPGAEAFCKFYGLNKEKTIEYIDNEAQPYFRAEQLLSKMSNHGYEDENYMETLYPQIYVFFCHGFVNGIQFGIRSNTPRRVQTPEQKKQWDRFVKLIGRHSAPIVLLYACSTGDDPDDDPDTAPGSGDDSFGDLLRDDLCKMGCTYNRVVSHYTAGHSFYNPDIKMFDGMGSRLGGIGGLPLVKRGTKEYRALNSLLKRKPKDADYGLVWRFPFMTIGSIHQELSQY